MTLKQAVVEYRDVYLAYRNYAPRTREEYTNDLEDLVKYLNRVGVEFVKDVRLSNLIRYMAELDRRGLMGTTRKRKVVAIKSFFSFMYSENHTHTNIARELIPPFVEERSPRYLTPVECSRLLKAAEHNKRDYAIIQLFLRTGIRLSELANLTVNDFQATNCIDRSNKKTGSLRILGNGRKKVRIIPLDTATCVGLEEYLFTKQYFLSDYLFRNQVNEPLSERGIEKVIRKYIILSNITYVSANSLRHTFGIHQLTRGMSINQIKEIMGIKDVRSINYYASLVNNTSLDT